MLALPVQQAGADFFRGRRTILRPRKLSHSPHRIFVAEVAELVDALDSKSSLAYPRWGFDSPLRHDGHGLCTRVSAGGEVVYRIDDEGRKPDPEK